MPYNKVKPSIVQHYHIGYNEFLRRASQDNSIFKDIRTILFILKATGLLPIYEEVSSYEIGPPTKPNVYYSFFIRGFVQALTIFNLYNLVTPGAAQLFYSYSDTDNVNKWIEILLCMLAHWATVVICARNSKSFLKIINEILKVDEDVFEQFGTTLENKCGFLLKFIVGICICQWYLMVLQVLAAKGPLTVNSYIFIVFYAVQNSMSTIFIVFTAALLRIVKMRFAHLNTILKGYTYTKQRKLRRFLRCGRNAHSMDLEWMDFAEDSLFTYRMHNKLLRIYRSINDCCSLILVTYMGYAFYTITTTTYNLFVQITTQSPTSLNVLQTCFAWLAMHTCVLALLSRSCGQATDEANGTSQVLSRVYNKSKDLKNIVDKFLTKSIKQEVQFTAYGFFVIDNSTLFKIFSAVTTYLVILIQFKQLEDSKLEDDSV
ncbi:gustatory and pheromone receptor 32a isoform X1 [Anastrepha obliqua]|uniref:gustatory and pheromone receptor 32a isoform X1 n=1 Tax=Anastrepha obliqua TaxID=95512 RepID=UPI00240A66D8|nr:gustatory and pheromone receptor 32a isoform X1 [Anastrepha obliqua]